MANNKPTIEEMKKQLDEHGVDYSSAEKRADYVELLNKIEVPEANHDEEVETEEASKQTDILSKFKEAKKVEIERTVTKKEDKYSYLDTRDYDSLDVAEREIIKQRSPEYESKTSGIKVKVTERLVTAWRIVRLADISYSKLIKGSIYTMSQDDYDVLKDVTVKVKTEATKNKCCGGAVYEEILLLEVA